jgi:LL-diaminopimelate aminotransferase
MAGRGGEWRETGWNSIVYLPCTGGNGFVPSLPEVTPDLIYLCYPNNPTGTVLTREQLSAWVAYARAHDCVILYDSAYEAFITDPAVPHSIFEVPGALDVAVEFRSFSKTAGFTGLRCAYVAIPPAVAGRDGRGRAVPLAGLWTRRQSTKYNGCPYIVQRAAAAVYEPEGRAQIREVTAAYQENARHILHTLTGCGLGTAGGINAPYVWAATPEGMSSRDFFDRLLHEAGVVCTPGAGFGPAGEGWVRFTAFATAEDTRVAMQRLRAVLGRNAAPEVKA